MIKKYSLSAIFPAFVLFMMALPSLAYAHHAEIMRDKPLLQGLSMPIHGLDHMMIAVAVGLIATQIGGRALWMVPLTFSFAILAGGLLNLFGIPIPFVEQGILASIVVFGALLTWRKSVSVVFSLCLVGIFAAFHGNVLIPVESNIGHFLIFAAGCFFSALILQSLGIMFGLLIRRFPQVPLYRYAGFTMVVLTPVVSMFPKVNSFLINLLEAGLK